MGLVQSASNELSKQTKSSAGGGGASYDPAAALRSIDNMIGKVEGLKRKVCMRPCAGGGYEA